MHKCWVGAHGFKEGNQHQAALEMCIAWRHLVPLGTHLMSLKLERGYLGAQNSHGRRIEVGNWIPGLRKSIV
jgi:hypothetical protein